MAYLGKTPSQAVRSRYYFTASGGETSLSPSEVTGLSFTDANYVDVSLNGVALVSGTDYTATPSTNTISGLAALTASDVVEIVVYDTFSVFGGSVNGDFNISGGDLTLGDNDKAIFGAGSDLQIYHDGSHSYIEDQGTGNLYVKATNLRLNNSANVSYLSADSGGAVSIYHNGNQKFATTSTGVDVTGTVTADGLDVQGDGTISGGSRLTISAISDVNNDGIRLDDSTTSRFNNLSQDSSGNFKIQHWTGSAWQNNLTLTTGGNLGIADASPQDTLHVGGTGTTGIKIGTQGSTGRARIFVDSGNDYALTVDTQNVSDALVINRTSGNVGINTASPSLATASGSANGLEISGTVPAINLNAGSGDEFLIYGGASNANILVANSNPLRFIVGGSEAARIDSSGNVGIGTTSPGGELEVYRAGTSEILIGTDNGGTAQLSLYESDDGTKEGLLKYDGTNNRIHLATSGAPNALVIPRDSGNVGIGTDSPSQPLTISTSGANGLFLLRDGATAANSARIYFDSSNTTWAIMNEDADLSFRSGANPGSSSGTERVAFTVNGINSSAVAANGTVSAANLFISGGNNFQKSTSSSRYKTDITDSTRGLSDVMNIRSVTYKGINDGDRFFGGLIAEEVHDAGLIEYVDYRQDDDGNDIPEGVHYGHMVALAFKAIQELKAELDAEKVKTATLETQRADLEARLTALENAE